MIRALLLFAILATSWVARSQQCDQTATAIILDEKTSTFVPAITPQMLKVKVGRTEVPVTSVERIAGSRVLFLIDDSGSMEEGGGPLAPSYQAKALARVSRTLNEMMNSLPPGVQVEYGIFHNHAAFAGRFSADARELSDSLAEVRARLGHPKRRKTALYDAIHEGLAQFDSPQPGDSMLILTDGGDNVSVLSAKRVQREAGEKGIRLFAILIKQDFIAPNEASDSSLFEFAERTGGSVHIIDPTRTVWAFEKASAEEVRDLRRFWTDEVLAGYVLRFNVPASAGKDQKWSLSVSRSANPRGGIVAAYPTHLRSCSLTMERPH